MPAKLGGCFMRTKELPGRPVWDPGDPYDHLTIQYKTKAHTSDLDNLEHSVSQLHESSWTEEEDVQRNAYA